MNEQDEKKIQEHMQEFSTTLEEYKELTIKDFELRNLVKDLPYEKTTQILNLVGDMMVISITAGAKGAQEADRIAQCILKGESY